MSSYIDVVHPERHAPYLDIPDDVVDYLHYLDFVKLRSPRTVNGYYLDLRGFFRYMMQRWQRVADDAPPEEIDLTGITTADIRTITKHDIFDFLDHARSADNGPKARARKLSALKGFFNYMCTQVNRLPANPTENISLGSPARALPKYLTRDEAVTLLSNIQSDFYERDYCILTLFLNCGMRLAELVTIDMGDFRDDTIRIVGKGSKERLVYLNDACLDALQRYKKVRTSLPNLVDRDALFVSKRTGKVWRNGRTRATGRNEKASMDWYRSTMDKPKRIHARYLNQEERIPIADRLRPGDSIRAIARLLGRDPGTVSREVERNRNPESGGYEPYRAQQKAADRLKRPKPRKAAEGTRLWDEIAAGLRRHWSPEQIANRLRLDFPDNGDMHASVETIYQAIYLQARGELKQELKRAMRQGRTARRPQGGQGRKPRFREPMAMISERPPEIEDRAVPGHWEGDLITGSRNKSAIGTLVERTTRFTILLHLPDGHDAEHVQQAIIDKMQHLPKLLRNSLTWDQGAELALHKRIGASLDMAVYFCDPHSPWQRGTNENTNGLLRQYFPKGTDLSKYPEDYLDAVAEELNDRPRKTLGFMKPSEKIIELLDAA